MVDSSLPPEVLFHRFFQSLPNPLHRDAYRGKQDLDRLPDDLRYPLAETQAGLNASFARSRDAVAKLGRPLVVHFDYVDSRVENALAFEHGGYQFIGVTIRLIELILERCENLVQSDGVGNLLNLSVGCAERGRASGGLFMAQLIFVVAHEFGHHLLGHALSNEAQIWNEVMADGRVGSLEDHAQECLADACAVYQALGFLIDGEQRTTIAELFGRASTRDGEADAVLLSAFLLSVSAFFFARPPASLGKSSISLGTHPPAVVRINGLIQTVRTWCSKYRPALDLWTTDEEVERIVAAAAAAVGRENWREQFAFLESSDGKEYHERLGIQLLHMQPPEASSFC
jgi:hypothetical protein